VNREVFEWKKSYEAKREISYVADVTEERSDNSREGAQEISSSIQRNDGGSVCSSCGMRDKQSVLPRYR
jgi:hypothetical protein